MGGKVLGVRFSSQRAEKGLKIASLKGNCSKKGFIGLSVCIRLRLEKTAISHRITECS